MQIPMVLVSDKLPLMQKPGLATAAWLQYDVSTQAKGPPEDENVYN